jgi:hypothetical protein
MNAARLAAPVAAIAAVFALAHAATAQTFGSHPALSRSAAAPVAQIDPNTFIVAHPAGLALRSGHANYAHPADVTSHQQATIDTNRFLVQPPSSVTWGLAPLDTTVAVAAPR